MPPAVKDCAEYSEDIIAYVFFHPLVHTHFQLNCTMLSTQNRTLHLTKTSGLYAYDQSGMFLLTLTFSPAFLGVVGLIFIGFFFF